MVKPLKSQIKVVGYLRTSSATNVGKDKGSDKRQKKAISGYAAANGFKVVDWYYDAAVSGADPVDTRPGFKALLDRLIGNGVKHILIESPDRFARDLQVQIVGHDKLKAMGFTLIPTTAPDFFTEDTPTAVMVRNVLGAVSQFEKATLVAKLKDARDEKKAEYRKAKGGPKDANGNGKCGGRDTVAERYPEAVAMAKKLYRVRKDKPSLRDISAALAAAGHVSVTLSKDGEPLPEPIKRPFTAEVVWRMLDKPRFRTQTAA